MACTVCVFLNIITKKHWESDSGHWLGLHLLSNRGVAAVRKANRIQEMTEAQHFILSELTNKLANP